VLLNNSMSLVPMLSLAYPQRKKRNKELEKLERQQRKDTKRKQKEEVRHNVCLCIFSFL